MTASSVGSTAIVLVVEDEPILRMAATALVEEAGLQAVEASSADEAILILEQRTDIRVVFTDIDMPGSMDGLKLAAAVRGRWPPIEIIVTSGHRLVGSHELPPCSVFFSKPYRDKDVVDALRRLAA